MSTTDPAPAPRGAGQPVAPLVRLIVTAVIALAVLVFSYLLFQSGDKSVGGALAGMVVAHYFSQAHSQAIGDQLMRAAAAVGAMVKPPA